MWSDAEDEIIGGDLTAALAYATSAGGAVATPVAPVGLRDREAGTVGFTTSLGFGRKLDRIRENPRVALAYHAREHGFADTPRYVLVQGTASYDSTPDRAYLEEHVRPASDPLPGPAADGRLLGPLAQRLLRRSRRGDGEGRARRLLAGSAVRGRARGPRRAPLRRAAGFAGAARQGHGSARRRPRVARRLDRLGNVLLAYIGADGFPVVAPVASAPPRPAVSS